MSGTAARVQYHGNSEVVELAKNILAEAEKGRLVYLAFTATHATSDNKVCLAHAGAYTGIPGVLVGIDLLSNELKELQKKRSSSPNYQTSNASYHEYNLATDPISFDFAHWLIDAEMIRRRMDAPAPLRVGFRHAEELTDHGRKWLDNVFRPMLTMIGAVESDAALGGWRKALFVPTEIVAACKRGEEVARFRADDASMEQTANWLAGRCPVTITLREANHWSHRNSNMEAWMKFAGDLRAKGEDVVFVRDTAKGNEPIEGFETWPIASFKLNLRHALYEASKINMIVSNGPGALMVWGNKPYLYFVPLEDHPDYHANHPDFWPEAQGIAPGEQWPWALPGQQMIWTSDTYENICAAWEAR